MSRMAWLREQFQNIPDAAHNSPHYPAVDFTGLPDVQPVDVYVKDAKDEMLARKDIKAAALRGEKRATRAG